MKTVLLAQVLHEANTFAVTPAPIAHYERQGIFRGPQVPERWGGSPLTNTPLVSSCDGKNLYGWPCDAQLEKLRADFLHATTDRAQRDVIEALQRRYHEVAPYISTGIVQRQVAYRSTLNDVLKTPYPVFWNVSKSE